MASAKLKEQQSRAAEAKLRRESGELVAAATHEAVMGEIFGLFRRTMMSLHPQVSRALHLPPAQDDTVRDVVYSALKQMAEVDVLDGLDLRLGEDK